MWWEEPLFWLVTLRPSFGLWCTCCCGRYACVSWSYPRFFVVNSFKFGWSHPHFDWYFEPQAPSKMVDADHQSDLHNCWLPWKLWKASSTAITKACLKIGYPKICLLNIIFPSLAILWGCPLFESTRSSGNWRMMTTSRTLVPSSAPPRANSMPCWRLPSRRICWQVAGGHGRIHVRSKMGMLYL